MLIVFVCLFVINDDRILMNLYSIIWEKNPLEIRLGNPTIFDHLFCFSADYMLAWSNICFLSWINVDHGLAYVTVLGYANFTAQCFGKYIPKCDWKKNALLQCYHLNYQQQVQYNIEVDPVSFNFVKVTLSWRKKFRLSTTFHPIIL